MSEESNNIGIPDWRDELFGVTQQMPSDVDAERSLLSALLNSPTRLTEVAKGLTAEDFFADDHRIIFAAILDLARSARPVTPLKIESELAMRNQLQEAGGCEYLSTLATLGVGAEPIGDLVKSIREKSFLRWLIKGCFLTIASVLDSGKGPLEHVEYLERELQIGRYKFRDAIPAVPLHSPLDDIPVQVFNA
jgi:replicative DNA helicase